MDFYFDVSIAANYKSNSQKARVLSEYWVGKNMYCPICGKSHICNLRNNMPVADLRCDRCGEIFELKSKKGKIGKTIPDGSYFTMIERINSAKNPHLFVLSYNDDQKVTDLTFIPKFFFVDSIIQRRKPLPPGDRRAGWIGCKILYNDIPCQGRIEIIRDSSLKAKSDVVLQYSRIKNLQTDHLESRGWLMDVLNLVNRTKETEFSLEELYGYASFLEHKYPNNHNIKAKIRQQLQVLRDKGIVEFRGRGKYRKLM
ncbi:MAG: hypothetical protein NC084_07185 [Bacteroides sp.]|nr:restriction endonuclease [Eubacterium sp.]MCM1418381.1 restriction endonuclease [Roseburia sp.]MCM1462482.1 hypothetical protein [Bacteroides sp.]